MVNNQNFGKRIKKIMEYYDFSASSFAEKIGVQRSSISHILSGRNKPSLDFVIKITRCFDEVDIEWLVNGKGTFPLIHEEKEIKTSTPTLFDNKTNAKEKKIERIVVFYNDGTFDEYYK